MAIKGQRRYFYLKADVSPVIDWNIFNKYSHIRFRKNVMVDSEMDSNLAGITNTAVKILRNLEGYYNSVGCEEFQSDNKILARIRMNDLVESAPILIKVIKAPELLRAMHGLIDAASTRKKIETEIFKRSI